MADTGWVEGTVANATFQVNDAAWSNASNMLTNDGNDASVTVDDNSSDVCHVKTFGITLPANATIDGIELQCVNFNDNNTNIAWDKVGIAKNGTDTGANVTYVLPTGTDQTDQAGGPTSLWLATWTTNDIAHADTGPLVGGRDLSPIASTLNIDAHQMKVYYTTVTITDVDGDETWTDGDTGLVITGTSFV